MSPRSAWFWCQAGVKGSYPTFNQQWYDKYFSLDNLGYLCFVTLKKKNGGGGKPDKVYILTELPPDSAKAMSFRKHEKDRQS